MKKLLMTVAALFGAVQAWGVNVSTWATLKSNLEAGNDVTLTADFAYSGNVITIKGSGTRTLNMNGHTITATSSDRFFYLTTANLTITGTGTFNGNGKTYSSDGHFAYISSGKTLTIGGNVTIKNMKVASGKSGGAIFVNGGALVMNAGAISSATAPGWGGGVYITEGGSFTMNAGTISSCTTSNNGGAVNVAKNSTFTMKGGTIDSCSANYGGGVYAEGTNSGYFYWYGGVIKSCSATQFGHAVYCDKSGYATLYGGVVLPINSNNLSQYVKPASGYEVKGLSSMSVIGKSVSASGDKLRGGTYYFNPTDSWYSNAGLGLDTCCTVTGSAGAYTVNAPYTVTVQAVNGANVSVSGSGQTGSAAGSYLVPKGGSITATYSAKSGYVMVGGVTSSSLSNVQANQTLSTSGISTIAVSSTTPSSCSTWDQVRAVLGAGYDVKLVSDFDFPNTGSDNGGNVAAGTHTLDMNGHTITAQGSYRFFHLNNGSLKIIGTGTFNGNGKTFVSHGHFAYVPSGKTLTIDGDVTIKNMKTAANMNGGAIYVAGGALVMNAGTISSATSQNHGGGVFVNAGSFTMNGGTITNCTSGCHGGGVYVYTGTTFTMNGGTISGCTAPWYGGAVFCYYGTTTIKGGTISGCTAESGGGILSQGTSTVTMTGGTISGCAATGTGGGAINVNDSNVTFTMNGGVLTGNTASGSSTSASAIIYNNGGTATVNGGVSDNSHIGDFKASGKSCTQVGTKYIVGTDIAFDSNNQLTAGTYMFCPTNAEYVAAGVAVKEGKFIVREASTTPAGYQISDTPYVMASTWAQLKANLEAGNSVTLAANMDADSYVGINSAYDLIIDMNGKIVTRTASTRLFNYEKATIRLKDSVGGGKISAGTVSWPYRGAFALLNENATFVLDGNVTIDGFNAGGSSNEGTGGAFAVDSGASLVINNGTIRGCSANTSGGAVYLKSGATFTMNGGTITNCTAALGGAAYNVGTVTMNDGVISGCTATDNSGAICIQESGTMTLNGGVIADNYAPWHGGIVVHGSSASMKVYGGTFRNNTAANNAQGLGLAVNYGKIDVYGGNFEGVQQFRNTQNGQFNFYGGVFDQKPSTDVPSGSAITLCDGNVETQVGDKWVVGKSVVSDANNQLTAGTYTFNPTNAEYVAAGVVDASKVAATGSGTSYTLKATGAVDCSDWAQLKANLEAGNDVKLVDDFDFPNTGSDNGAGVAAGTHTLDMNGHTITAQGSYRFFNLIYGSLKITGTGTFNGNGKTYISDGHFAYVPTGKTLTIDGDVTIKNMKTAANMNGGAIYVAGGALVMNAGTIAGCTSQANAGAVYSVGTFTMNGGMITNCTAATTANGGGVYVMSGSTMTMSGGTISDCSAGAGGAIFCYGTTTMNGGTISGCSTPPGDNGGAVCVLNGTFTMNGGVLTGNTASGSSTSASAIIYNYGGTATVNGGVSDNSHIDDFKASGKSCTQVGTKYIVGTDIAFDANNQLTAGTYTFNPTNAEYAAAGVALAPGSFTKKTGDLEWQILSGTQIGDTMWGYVKNGACEIYGSGMVTNAAALKATGVTNLVVASGVTGIGANVFDGWSSIRDVSLGADCTNIASQAFLECRNLTNVTCAATASMAIGNHAFYWCNSLESMSFGAVPTFGEQAYTLQSGIYIKDGMPEIYPIPQISAPGYRLALMGSVDLQSWTEIKTEVEKLDYNFFKLKLEPSGK